jgi:hypothetical protein
MTNLDDRQKTIFRNTLLGGWAAGKLGLTGRAADDYADALGRAALDVEQGDVFSKIRKDFDAAGALQSDEEILRAIDEFNIEAGRRLSGKRGGSADAAELALKRSLASR